MIQRCHAPEDRVRIFLHFMTSSYLRELNPEIFFVTGTTVRNRGILDNKQQTRNIDNTKVDSRHGCLM